MSRRWWRTLAGLAPIPLLGCSLLITGNNASGQIGGGTTTKRDTPVAVLALPGGRRVLLGLGRRGSGAGAGAKTVSSATGQPSIARFRTL